MSHENSSKACLQCGTLIPVDAKKCAHCSSYQDWREILTWLGPSLSVIAVGAGLLLSLNEIAKLVENATRQPESLVQIYDVKLREGGIDVSLLNRGDAIAILDDTLTCEENTTSATPMKLKVVGRTNNFLGSGEHAQSRWDVWNAYLVNGQDAMHADDNLDELAAIADRLLDQYPHQADVNPLPRDFEFERLIASLRDAPHTPLYRGPRYFVSLAALAEMEGAQGIPAEYDFTCTIGIDDGTDKPKQPKFSLSFSPVSYGIGY